MAETLHQAIECHAQGKYDEAEGLYRSIAPDSADGAEALALLGVLLAEQGKRDEAVGSLGQAIRRDPTSALFHLYLGNIQGDGEAAMVSFRSALALQPAFAEAHYRLALLLEKKGDFAEAIFHLKQVTSQKPEAGEVWLALSDVARKNADYGLAQQAAKQAVRLMPDNVAAPIALGIALDFLNREEEALACFQQALQLKSDFIEAWDMLGATYQNLNRLDEAEVAMHKAIEIAGCAIKGETTDVDENQYAVQHWNLALLELLRGDYRNGFAHYRARFKKAGRMPRLAFPQPLWRGENLLSKKILAVGEQGYGDVLMMCRYLPMLRAQDAQVTLLARAELLPLLRLSGLAHEYISEAPQSQSGYDFQTSLFDLPYRFGTLVDTIPAPIPYLPLPPADEATTLPDDGKKRVGIVWAGRADFGNDRRRSLTPQQFTPLFANKNVSFFNLTHAVSAEDADFLAGHGVKDLSPLLTNFLQTAKFIHQMDIIITCDTAAAHLAGGMGKKVWLLLPFAPDWRWLTERADSPWYPSMLLFRQQIKSDWDNVILRVKAALSDRFPEK